MRVSSAGGPAGVVEEGGQARRAPDLAITSVEMSACEAATGAVLQREEARGRLPARRWPNDPGAASEVASCSSSRSLQKGLRNVDDRAGPCG